ncbi:MAG: hypothetical protein IK133_01005, partial [Clostridia bacterium]|nr:hypothetical protein [Clostridia bacterium]
FDYDHKGRCIGRTYVYYDTSRSKNVWRGYSYTWEGDRLVHLVTSNRVGDTGNYTTDETMHFHYDAQGKPSMLMYNGTRFGYVYNAQGDVIGIITGGLTEKVKYTYDAWGRLLSISGSSANTIGKANPFRYRAYIYDQECGLYYLRTRYYNPNWCRFINADNLVTRNLYVYCENNTINSHDPGGMREESIALMLVSIDDADELAILSNNLTPLQSAKQMYNSLYPSKDLYDIRLQKSGEKERISFTKHKGEYRRGERLLANAIDFMAVLSEEVGELTDFILISAGINLQIGNVVDVVLQSVGDWTQKHFFPSSHEYYAYRLTREYKIGLFTKVTIIQEFYNCNITQCEVHNSGVVFFSIDYSESIFPFYSGLSFSFEGTYNSQ